MAPAGRRDEADEKQRMITSQKSSSLSGKNLVDGEIKFKNFNPGINPGSTIIPNMPAQKIRIDAQNQEYSRRVKQDLVEALIIIYHGEKNNCTRC